MQNTNKVKVIVTTAKALDKSQRVVLNQLISSKLGHVFELEEIVDQTTIGGIKIRIGNQEYDTTIAGNLKRLRVQTPIVQLSTADGLSQQQKNKLQNKLQKMYPAGFVLEEIVDKSLLGGMRLNLNDQEFDGSIKNQLKKIHLQLKKSL